MIYVLVYALNANTHMVMEANTNIIHPDFVATNQFDKINISIFRSQRTQCYANHSALSTDPKTKKDAQGQRRYDSNE